MERGLLYVQLRDGWIDNSFSKIYFYILFKIILERILKITNN